MTRLQLRPFYTEAERARIYSRTYNHTWWPDHIERVDHTVAVLDAFAERVHATSVADLSCGDAAILRKSSHPWERVVLGDLVSGHGLQLTGAIEDTIQQMDLVDMFVCSETLEHVEDPDLLLREIRLKARHLLLSTPHGENHSRNPEHYWGWNITDIDHMLREAGWRGGRGELFTSTYEHPDAYTHQIWTVS